MNGAPIKRHLLRRGDVIEIGKYTLKFLLGRSLQKDGEIDVDTSQPLPREFHDETPVTMQLRKAGDVDLDPAESLPRLCLLCGPNAGRELRITRALTTIGRPGYQVDVITRRPTGYFLAHVEGEVFPAVNGQSVGTAAYALKHDDVIGVAGVQIQFRQTLGPPYREARSRGRCERKSRRGIPRAACVGGANRSHRPNGRSLVAPVPCPGLGAQISATRRRTMRFLPRWIVAN